MLLAALLVLHIGGKAAQLHFLKSREKQVDVSIRDAFHTAMPGDPNFADARRRMEQRLAVARGAGGGLLPALQALAQARDASPGTNVQSLNFHNGAHRDEALGPGCLEPGSPEPGAAQQRLAGGPAAAAPTAVPGYEGRIQVHGGGS